jgi:hypothetical protein
LSAFHVLQQLLRGASVSTSPAVKGEGAVSTTETIDEKHRSRNSSALSLRHEQYCSVWRMWLRQTPRGRNRSEDQVEVSVVESKLA